MLFKNNSQWIFNYQLFAIIVDWEYKKKYDIAIEGGSQKYMGWTPCTQLHKIMIKMIISTKSHQALNVCYWNYKWSRIIKII